MASDDMLSWLRDVIEGDKSLAEVAASSERYGVKYTGHWTYTLGDDLVYQERRRVPGAAGIVGRSCSCCGPASLGHPHDLMHVATHDPRDTIARCEAELALLDEMIPIIEELDDIAMGEGLGSVAYGEPTYLLVQKLASGYRHRPGFDPAWLTEFVPPEQFIWERTDERIAGGQITDPAWMEVSRASQAVRASLGINGSMRDARSVKHPFIAAKGKPYDAVQDGYLAQYCAACGEIQPLLAHKNARARS
jgi:hypothetical protein